jgi:polysaccharide chain length determinant protein (PEP-CTERM system associated)
MLPGKKYTPEDFVKIAWRRKWLIVIPTLVVASGTFVWSQSLPNRYRSEARILIVPQRVPENYVQPTVTTELTERLQAISQEILSRTRLERIIEEFNLYGDERKTMIMEDVIQLMRRDVAIDIAGTRRRRGDPGSFVVRYDSNSPRMAMQVVERLASLFITENLQDREVLAEQTSQFLQAQLEDARGRLIEHERKLEAYRRANMGQLPTQVNSNLQVMQSTQVQLQSRIDAMNRDHDRKLALDKLIAEAEAVQVVTPSSRGRRDASLDAPVRGSTGEQLAAARATLESLEARLTSEHPDVVRAKRVIRELETKAAVEALERPLTSEEPVAGQLSPAEEAHRQRLSEMQTEREGLERRIEANTAEQTRLQGVLATYRRNVEAAPRRESELIELMRDYDIVQGSYNSLLSKSQSSNIAADLERRQIGQQFRMIEAARLPQRPSSPNRARMNMMGTLAGLAFALALVALLEYRDTTMNTRGDVVASLALPIIAVIPAMSTIVERRKRKRQQVLIAAASSAVVISGVAAAVWRFQLLDNLPLLNNWVP